jgi:parallel beta-helix repeat protein/predicted outer membrane repeat protein
MVRSAAAIVALMVCGVTTAAPINVPGDYATIQAALDAASNGDEILVAPGTYTGTGYFPVINLLGKPITIRATGTAEETILDGEGERRGVVCDSGEGADTIIEGFTITGGKSGLNYGGGIYCRNESNPTITGCRISGNNAHYGGGIACYDASPMITSCTITGNTASEIGGGIICVNSNPTITGCTISGNTASSGTVPGGGGIYCYESSPTIFGSTISGNTSIEFGGGIYCGYNSSPTITYCTISGNTAGWSGGGIFTGGSYPTLLNSAVCGNSPNQIAGSYSDEGGNTVAEVCPIPGACCTNGECVIAEQADCLAFHATWLGDGTTCDDSPCPIACLSDVNGDGEVSVNDILTLIANWGPCP